MKTKYRVFLLGGNSLIGDAVLNGIKLRYENVEVIKFVRNKNSTDENIFQVESYKDSINRIESIVDDDKKNIYILSFGVLNEENRHQDLLKNLQNHIEINAYDNLFLFQRIKDLKNFHEIHIVSSVLSGFFRPSAGSYSISKYILSKALNIEVFLNEKLKNKLFIWNPAFIDSNLNQNRKSVLIKTSSKKITKKVTSKSKGGNYYIPSYSFLFVKLASLFEFLIFKVDKKVN
tara:strand:+ start:703 stop:1398 length:696 start_codon:yes stop_codon:yes gene_type:complete